MEEELRCVCSAQQDAAAGFEPAVNVSDGSVRQKLCSAGRVSERGKLKDLYNHQHEPEV